MFLSRYNDRPSVMSKDHDLEINGRTGRQYSLNEYSIVVWDDGEVTAQRKRHVSSSPERHFPNMSVGDGAITLPIEDLVSFVLARITARELAEGLLTDAETRVAMVAAMARRWSSPGFEDSDRRAFLAAVRAQVHSVALDAAVERLVSAEREARARNDYYLWRKLETGHYRGLYDRLLRLTEGDEAQRAALVALHTAPDALDAYIQHHRDPAAYEAAGEQWHESRDHWRRVLAERFLAPEGPPLAEEADPLRVSSDAAPADPLLAFHVVFEFFNLFFIELPEIQGDFVEMI